MAAARPPEKRKTKTANMMGDEILADARRELRLADNVLPFVEDTSCRVFRYTGVYWREIKEPTLKALVLRHQPRSLNRLRLEVINYLKATCHNEDHEWGRVEDYEIPFENGVLDIRSGKLRAHRIDDYLDSVIPWPYDRNAGLSSALESYLLGCFGEEDIERPRALQEFAGYVLAPHAKLKKAFYGQGLKDCGKTTFGMLLRMIVGKKQTCVISPEAMEDPGRLSPIVGKRLNLLTDLRSGLLIKDGIFKQLISTEEPVEINPKYVPSFDYAPVAKHAFFSNGMPVINDGTRATVDRFLLVQFPRVIPKADQDVELLAKFAHEMPGILRWAVDGAKRLFENGGQFSEVSSSVERLSRLFEESNPMLGFVKQMMKAEVNAVTPLTEIVAGYNRAKIGKQIDARGCGKMLRLAFGEESVDNAWDVTTKASASCFLGWRMRTNTPNELSPEGTLVWKTGAPADDTPTD